MADVAFPQVVELLRPSDFGSDANHRIAEAAWSLREEGAAIDAVTIATRLRRMGRLPQVGGTPYLAQLTDCTPAVANVGAHTRIVRSCSQARQLHKHLLALAAETGAPEADVPALIQRAKELLAHIDLGTKPTGAVSARVKVDRSRQRPRIRERRPAGSDLAAQAVSAPHPGGPPVILHEQ
ncbi:MAG TPA: DnaB-like helicase N-terminal domain-containing protein, partial [Polyangiaceae bacterium]